MLKCDCSVREFNDVKRQVVSPLRQEVISGRDTEYPFFFGLDRQIGDIMIVIIPMTV